MIGLLFWAAATYAAENADPAAAAGPDAADASTTESEEYSEVSETTEASLEQSDLSTASLDEETLTQSLTDDQVTQSSDDQQASVSDEKDPATSAEEQKPETPEPGKPSDEQKPETPEPGKPSDEQKPETPEPGKPSDEQKPETPEPGKPSDEQKPETPEPATPTEGPAESTNTTQPTTVPTPPPTDATPTPVPPPIFVPEDNGTIQTENNSAVLNPEATDKVTVNTVPSGTSLQIQGGGSSNFYLQADDGSSFSVAAPPTTEFGLYFDSEKKVNVIFNSSDYNMNLRGGAGTLNLSTKSSEKKINLTGNSVLTGGTFQFAVPKDTSLNVRSLALYDGSEASSPEGSGKVNIENITVGGGSQATITNVIVSNLITMGPSSQLGLTSADVSDSVVDANIDLGFQRPLFTGNLGEPPKAINLINSTAKLLEGEEGPITFTIIDNNDFSNCNDWRKALNLGNTIFQSSECVSSEGGKTHSLVVSTQKKSGGLTSGAIAGIVVACVVVVAVVVGVTVYFAKKKTQSLGVESTIDEEDSIAI